MEGLGQGKPSQTADNNEKGLCLLDFHITKMELSPDLIQEFYATKSEDFQTSLSIFFLSIFDPRPACSTMTEYTVWWVMSHQSTIGLTGLHIHGRRV